MYKKHTQNKSNALTSLKWATICVEFPNSEQCVLSWQSDKSLSSILSRLFWVRGLQLSDFLVIQGNDDHNGIQSHTQSSTLQAIDLKKTLGELGTASIKVVPKK